MNELPTALRILLTLHVFVFSFLLPGIPQKVQFKVSVRKMKDFCSDFDRISKLRSYPWLEEVEFDIDCESAKLCEVEELEAALTEAADAHPKRPMVQLVRKNVDKMVSTSDHCSTQVRTCFVISN